MALSAMNLDVPIALRHAARLRCPQSAQRKRSLEVRGRWDAEASACLRLARACASGTPAALGPAAQAAWVLRWSGITAVEAANRAQCCRARPSFARAPCGCPLAVPAMPRRVAARQ